MAASGISTGNSIRTRLYDLLRRAREIKRSTAIDPPLQVSALVDDDEPLIAPPEGDKEGHNFAVESAAKAILYAILGSNRIEDPSFVTVWDLLDILQYCGDRNLCSPQLVLLLLEELLDSLSIDGCRTALGFLESRREVLFAARSQNKDLVILRLCNELLRRLSRAEDPVFCGRVYIFLFHSFPLGDKSSVNLRGNFHTENVTTFEDYLNTSAAVGGEMQIDVGDPGESVKEEAKAGETSFVPAGEEKASKEITPTMDVDELYPVFWSLQHSFSNPPRLFEEDKFKEFKRGLEATLAKFKEVPKVVQAGDSARKKGGQSQSDGNYDEFASAFNPKYLTSRDLFKLELSDLAFQRHILVQALILIDFLLTLTEKSKSKPYYQGAQKAMQYSFTLREQDTEWALGIKNSIANYLQDGPDGKSYYRMVDTVLSRDKNWVRWKMENCHSFTRDRVPADNFVESKDGAKRAVVGRKAPKPMRSALGMQFLANTDLEKGLSQLKHHERFKKPSPGNYEERIETIQNGPQEGLSEGEKRMAKDKERSVTWRKHRLACKDNLSSYDDKRLKGADASTGDNTAPTDPEDRDAVPQEEHPSVEDQRPDQQDQVTTDMAAE
ncbi:nuclear matrix protein [Lentithecium fluviatile CBS 122367]|uniref:Nuclear matrix protein n=1 Tax=Lentithecium fluviatile CBS 122367 TaxID=1168545 RepID=A0A6G1JA88_9PLEO|nr:nuclear matrix protein [Lentithecium fluviatile CBS 122367]